MKVSKTHSIVRLWEMQWNKIIPGRGKWRQQSQIGQPGRASLKWRLNKALMGEWAMWTSGRWAFPARRIASEEPWTWEWAWPALEKARRPVCSLHHPQGEKKEETGQRGTTECSPEKEHCWHVSEGIPLSGMCRTEDKGRYLGTSQEASGTVRTKGCGGVAQDGCLH